MAWHSPSPISLFNKEVKKFWQIIGVILKVNNDFIGSVLGGKFREGLSNKEDIKKTIENQIASLSRHQIKDPFQEAKNKKKIEFSDLFEKQKIQKEQANKTFEERVKEKHTFKEEDKRDFWD